MFINRYNEAKNFLKNYDDAQLTKCVVNQKVVDIYKSSIFWNAAGFVKVFGLTGLTPAHYLEGIHFFRTDVELQSINCVTLGHLTFPLQMNSRILFTFPIIKAYDNVTSRPVFMYNGLEGQNPIVLDVVPLRPVIIALQHLAREGKPWVDVISDISEYLPEEIVEKVFPGAIKKSIAVPTYTMIGAIRDYLLSIGAISPAGGPSKKQPDDTTQLFIDMLQNEWPLILAARNVETEDEDILNVSQREYSELITHFVENDNMDALFYNNAYDDTDLTALTKMVCTEMVDTFQDGTAGHFSTSGNVYFKTVGIALGKVINTMAGKEILRINAKPFLGFNININTGYSSNNATTTVINSLFKRLKFTFEKKRT